MDWSNISAAIAGVWGFYVKTLLPGLTPIGALLAGVVVAWTALKQVGIAARRHDAQTEADRQRRITESYSKAVEQLSSDKIEQRLGGIYILERISRESTNDYWTIMETLTAFVRERARWKEPSMEELERPLYEAEFGTREERYFPELPHALPTDIAAVLSVIKRRSDDDRAREQKEGWRLDLSGCDLCAANLSGVHLERANLAHTWLNNANLAEAHFEHAYLRLAHLESADLTGAYFENADLFGAHLFRAHLPVAHFEGASLFKADLDGANLIGATGLTQKQLDEACGTDVKLPPGLTIKPCP